MQTEQIVSLLVAERDRLNAAIHALGGSEKRRGRPVGSGQKKAAAAPTTNHGVATKATAPKKRQMSAAARKRIGEATRKRWAAFRAAKTAGAGKKKAAKA